MVCVKGKEFNSAFLNFVVNCFQWSNWREKAPLLLFKHCKITMEGQLTQAILTFRSKYIFINITILRSIMKGEKNKISNIADIHHYTCYVVLIFLYR